MSKSHKNIDSLEKKEYEFSECKKKSDSRQVFINKYRQYMKRKSIPSKSQYWTLCGLEGRIDDTHEEGKLRGLLHGSEFDQVLREGLIKPEQFYGVEREEKFHRMNLLIDGGTWINNDFYETILDYHFRDEFNPAIVNFDSINLPFTNPNYLARLFEVIVDSNVNNVMLVLNMVLQCANYYVVSPDEIMDQLKVNNIFCKQWVRAIDEGSPWKYEPFCYTYNGTGSKSQTAMGTMIFYRGGTDE